MFQSKRLYVDPQQNEKEEKKESKSRNERVMRIKIWMGVSVKAVIKNPLFERGLPLESGKGGYKRQSKDTRVFSSD